MPRAKTTATKTTFEFDGTKCTIARRESGFMAPTPTVLAARARGIWTCDRVAYVFSLAARKIAQGVA